MQSTRDISPFINGLSPICISTKFTPRLEQMHTHTSACLPTSPTKRRLLTLLDYTLVQNRLPSRRNIWPTIAISRVATIRIRANKKRYLATDYQRIVSARFSGS